MSIATYKIQVLDDKDYDSLHKTHGNVKEETLKDSFGFANKKTGEAFVRRTNVKEMDAITLQHELDELLQKNSGHEDENGIRWKKGSEIVKNYVAPIALSLIPGVGPVLAAAYSGINNYQTSGNYGQALLSAGTSYVGGKMAQGSAGYKAGVDASVKAGGGVVGQTLSGGQGLLQGVVGALPGFGPGGSMAGVTNALTPGAVTAGKAALAVNPMAAGLPATSYQQMGNAGAKFAPAGNLGVNGAAPVAGNLAGNAGAGINMAKNLLTGNVPLYGSEAPAGAPMPGATESKNLLTSGAGTATKEVAKKTLGGTIAGLGTDVLKAALPTMIGNQLFKMPEIPAFPDINDPGQATEAMQRTLGGSPLSQVATERAMEIIQGDPLTKEDESAILKIFDEREQDAMAQVDQTYQLYGRLGSEEHKSMRQKEADKWQVQRAYALTAARRDAQTMQNQMIQSSFGYDRQQVADMINLLENQGKKQELEYMIKAGDTMGMRQLFSDTAKLIWGNEAGETGFKLEDVLKTAITKG